MDERFEAREWCGLLEEARQALSTLRVEDLEELAARAARIFDADQGHEPLRQEFRGVDLEKLTRERRLLSELILATDRNLGVLRRLGHSTGDGSYAEGEDQRWAR